MRSATLLLVSLVASVLAAPAFAQPLPSVTGIEQALSAAAEQAAQAEPTRPARPSVPTAEELEAAQALTDAAVAQVEAGDAAAPISATADRDLAPTPTTARPQTESGRRVSRARRPAQRAATAPRASAPPLDPSPVPGVTLTDDGEYALPIQLLLLLTVLTLAPSILILMTSFTRLVVVFAILRTALGMQQSPPTQVLIGLSLFLTFFVMNPVFTQVDERALQPYLAGEIEQSEALEIAVVPMKGFMLEHTRDKDLVQFMDMAGIPPVAAAADVPLHVLVPAFVISELRVAFQIGFLLFLPFLGRDGGMRDGWRGVAPSSLPHPSLRHVGYGAKDLGREVGQHLDHPRREHEKQRGHGEHLRDDAERHFLDRGHRLEQAHRQTDGECNREERHPDRQRGRQRGLGPEQGGLGSQRSEE